MLTGGRLTDAALEILHGDDDRAFRWQLPHFDAQCFANGNEVFDRIETASVRRRLGGGQAATRLRLGERLGRPAEKFRRDSSTPRYREGLWTDRKREMEGKKMVLHLNLGRRRNNKKKKQKTT